MDSLKSVFNVFRRKLSLGAPDVIIIIIYPYYTYFSPLVYKSNLRQGKLGEGTNKCHTEKSKNYVNTCKCHSHLSTHGSFLLRTKCGEVTYSEEGGCPFSEQELSSDLTCATSF